MKLVMTLVVRDEAEILRANLDYHLAQGVDFVIATDHGSEDGTSEILAEYERMGVAKVIRDDREGHHQSERVTRMAEIALRDGADWLIHNDADEFWWPLVGSLRDVFSAIPERYGRIEVQRRNFRPRVDDEEDGDGPFHARLRYREARSRNLLGHPLEPKVAHRPREGVVVEPGNHWLRETDLAPLPAAEVLEILHFPARSFEQFERKVVQTGLGYELLSERSPDVGRDQLALLELQRAGRLREHYERTILLDEETLARGLRLGTLVLDRRLDEFMRALGEAGERHARPEEPFAGRMLERMMGRIAALEDRDAEVAELRGEIERLHQEHSALSAHQATIERELASTREALELLRSSRLLRSTAAARRLYYRTRDRKGSA